MPLLSSILNYLGGQGCDDTTTTKVKMLHTQNKLDNSVDSMNVMSSNEGKEGNEEGEEGEFATEIDVGNCKEIGKENNSLKNEDLVNSASMSQNAILEENINGNINCGLEVKLLAADSSAQMKNLGKYNNLGNKTPSNHVLSVAVADSDSCEIDKSSEKSNFQHENHTRNNDTSEDGFLFTSNIHGEVKGKTVQSLDTSVITQNMLTEERQYIKEDGVEVENNRERVVEQIKAAPEDERFCRLKSLLNKSNVYAQFLLKQMDQQRQQEKARREQKEEAKELRALKVAKRKAAATDKSSAPDEISNSSAKKKLRKRKRNDMQEENSKNLSRKGTKRVKTQNQEWNGEANEDAQEILKDNLNDIQLSEDQFGEDHLNENDLTSTLNNDIKSDRQPILVSGGQMRSYQIDGMEWMRGLFENGINGILADEMGLGKTLQCIALLSYFIEKNMRGPFLIAAPLSTLPNWISEFKKFTPKIKTLLYHGSKDERHLMRHKIMKLRLIDEEMNIKAYPIIVTSYEIIMRDRAYLNSYPWKYIIIDEGHRIKNLNCRLISELKTYRFANRLLLTGTPLQNNLAELWSLLNFLLPDIFDDLKSFQEWFDFSGMIDEQLIAQEHEANVLGTLHAILTPFLLRRLKADVDLTIPPKRELIVYAPLTSEQQEFYKGTLDKTILDKLQRKSEPKPEIEYTATGRPKRKSTKSINFKDAFSDDDSENFDFEELLERMNAEEARKKKEAAASLSKPYSVISIKLQNILMQLRKCCNHPYLLEYPIHPETQECIVDEKLVKVSGKMQLLDRMLAELKKRGHKVLLFSQMTRMLDIVEDFCHLRKYDYSRIDGSMNVPERQEMIDRFNNDPDVLLFLLSTRAGGLGLNLVAADTCIIYDSDWNPQVDLQAQDRCHRIGQTKPVLIFRFVTANSIDEKIVERAASKRKLEKMVIHKGHFKGKRASTKISSEDLIDLLQSQDHSHVSSIADDFVISDANLNKLLDRSIMLQNSESRLAESNAEKSDLFKVVEQQEDDVLL